MKKGVWILALLTSLFFINFVSAQFFDGYGWDGRISLSDFFDSLDPSTVTYGLLFFIFFTVIFLILTKVNLFRGRRSSFGHEEPNTMAAGVVSFAISSLIVYYIYRSGYNIESFFYEMGFSVDVFSFLMLAVFVLMTFFLIKRFKSAGFFMILGLLLMFISITTNIIYEKETTFVIGVILFIIGVFLGRNIEGWWQKEIRTR